MKHVLYFLTGLISMAAFAGIVIGLTILLSEFAVHIVAVLTLCFSMWGLYCLGKDIVKGFR